MGAQISVRMGGVTTNTGGDGDDGPCQGWLEVTVLHPTQGITVHSFNRRRNNVANKEG